MIPQLDYLTIQFLLTTPFLTQSPAPIRTQKGPVRLNFNENRIGPKIFNYLVSGSVRIRFHSVHRFHTIIIYKATLI